MFEDASAKCILYAAFTAGVIAAADEQDQHPVAPVMMHALRRGEAGLSRQRFDAKLMRLDRPRVRTLWACIRDKGGGAQHQRLKQRRSRSSFGHRREPAFDAAIQWIVIALLVMRAMRQARAFSVCHLKGGIASATIGAAGGHPCVARQIIPTPRKRCPFRVAGISQLARRQELGGRRGDALAGGNSESPGHVSPSQ